jgi:apoptosis-inducing factor 2
VSRTRVVVAGLGDSGLLTAIHLVRHADVVGISAKPGLVSGQELGMRLTRPDHWAKDYRISFDRYRRLDRARTVHGILTGLDLAARTVTVQDVDGTTYPETYDVLVIATGVTNGFWRQPTLQSADEVEADLRAAHERLASVRSVIVVGGGAAAGPAGRPVLSRRTRPAPAPSARLATGAATPDRPGCGPPPGPPGHPSGRIRG